MVDLLTQDQVNQLTGATDVGVKFPVEGAVPVWTTEYPHHICGFYQVVKGGNDRTYISGRREVQFEGAIDVYELKHHTATTDIADYKKVGIDPASGARRPDRPAGAGMPRRA